MKADYFDKRGIPICEGDLIRSPHFVGARNKMHYLYHVIVKDGGILYMVPTSHLVPRMQSQGGKCPLSSPYSDTWTAEIISGYGPSPYISFEDRPRRKMCARCGEAFLPLKRERTCEECELEAEIEREEYAESKRKGAYD